MGGLLVTVLVAHKSRLVRQALAKILSLHSLISVVGDAADGPDVDAKVEKLAPDVIVVDTVLPKLNGVLGNSGSKNNRPEVVVFSRSGNGNGNGNGQSKEAGHLDYDRDISDLVEAVITAGGEAVQDAQTRQEINEISLDQLTKREKQILGLVADGLSNKQIAHDMYITERTVKYHISNILRKLNIFSRTEAAVLFLKERWLAGSRQ